jgi:Protein of unknown function (DUF3108)
MPVKSSRRAAERDRSAACSPAIFGLFLLSALALISLAGRSYARIRRVHPRAAATPMSLPATVDVPVYRQGRPPFADGETLVYDANWEGIPAAEARVTVLRNRAHPQWWTGQMWINTSKVVDPLYRMRDYFREDFKFESWQPDQIYIRQHEKSRQDTWRATFDRPQHLITAIKTNKEGRTWIRKFSGGAPWGPFSGAMMALSQPLHVGENYVFDVFSGGNRYVFGFKVLGREQLTTGLGTFHTVKIEPSVIWLSQGDFRKDATETLIWVTDDFRHLPVRIESAVYIGSVRADLTRVEGVKPEAAPASKGDDDVE